MIVCLIDCFELAFFCQLYVTVEADHTLLILDILRVLVLIPSDHHVLIVVDRVHVLYMGRLEADVILVEELALGFGVDVASQTQ